MDMTQQPITAKTLFARNIEGETETFKRDAKYVAELAAHIADKTPSSSQKTTSGDLIRLSQYVADLLRQASKLEASLAALELMESE